MRVGGTIEGNVNASGATIQQNLGLGFNRGNISQPTADELAALDGNLGALSSTLAALVIASNPSSITIQNNTATFNAVDNGAGFALFNVDASIFANQQFDYNFGTANPVIINIFDRTQTVLTYGANPIGGNNASCNGQVIWNFVNATRIDFTRMVHGSVIALDALVTNTTPIEGSMAVGRFDQGGVVHLGTYAGGNSLLGVVPEPAVWAQLIVGFGLVGAFMRRRKMQTVG